MAETKIRSQDILDATVTDTDVAAANKDGTTATPSLRTLGTGAAQAAPGNDTRFLPADTVVAAGTRILANKLVGTDTQPAYRLYGDGKMEWGPGGTTAPDVNLYRSAGSMIKTDGFLNVQDLFTVAYGRAKTRVGSADQIQIGDRGGDGATACIAFGSAQDANLYRTAVGVLRTDGSLIIGGQLRVTNIVAAAVGGAQANKLPLYDANGILQGYIPIYAS